MNFGFCNKCFTLVLLKLKKSSMRLKHCARTVYHKINRRKSSAPLYTWHGNEPHSRQIIFLHLASCHLAFSTMWLHGVWGWHPTIVSSNDVSDVTWVKIIDELFIRSTLLPYLTYSTNVSVLCILISSLLSSRRLRTWAYMLWRQSTMEYRKTQSLPYINPTSNCASVSSITVHGPNKTARHLNNYIPGFKRGMTKKHGTYVQYMIW